jgi:hypothetical protein
MPREPRPLPTITARFEIDDDNPVRGTVELTPAEKSALEAEKRQMLASMTGPRSDDAPRARRLGRVRPEAMPDPDDPGLEDPRDTSVLGNLDDDSPIRRTLDLDPAEVARLEDERRQLVAGILAPRRAEEVTVEPPVELHKESSPELETANAAMAEIDSELASVEQAMKAERQAQEAETKRRDLENRARLDAIRARRAVVEAEATKIKQAQEAAALAARTQAMKAQKTRQALADRTAIATRSIELVKRIQPSLDALRAAHRELAPMLRQHGMSLEALSVIDVGSDEVPAVWDYDTRQEFMRMVVSPARRIFIELRGLIRGYAGEHIPRLEKLIAAGWQNRSDFELEVNTALHHLEPVNTLRNVEVMREGIANLSAALARFDFDVPVVETIRPKSPVAQPMTRDDQIAEQRGQTQAILE